MHVDGYPFTPSVLAAVGEILASILSLNDNSVCVAQATSLIKTPVQLDAIRAP